MAAPVYGNPKHNAREKFERLWSRYKSNPTEENWSLMQMAGREALEICDLSRNEIKEKMDQARSANA